MKTGNDPAFVAQALGTIDRSKNFGELARNVGISREGRYKALLADGNPSVAPIVKMAKARGRKIEFQAVALATRMCRQRSWAPVERQSSLNPVPE